MATVDQTSDTKSSQAGSGRSRRRMTKAQRFAEHCKPLPVVAGETLQERVDRLDRSLDYLTQCFQEEFEVRDEGSLLVNVITQVLIPFAAISAAISLVYVRLVEWTATGFPSFERVAAFGYLAILVAVLLVLVYARASGHMDWVNAQIDRIEGRFRSSVPTRKETLTRNNLVNKWIYAWIVGAILVFIPLTFMVLRSGVANDLGIRLAIDTAGVCDGSGRIRIFTGGETCVEIQEDHLDELSDTASTAVIGNLDAAASFASIEIADTPAEAQVAEIRLDTTTTLALAMFVLILGILANMARWWWRNRKQRNIDLM